MWQRQNIIRTLLFVVFFSVGVAALGISVLCDDLHRYYHNKRLLKEKQDSIERLQSLNADYNAVIERVRSDPNLFTRIAPGTLGAEPAEANTVYPKIKAEQLAAARKALSKDAKYKITEPMIPDWLTRCSEPRRRITLFLAGAVLILISFICFGPVKQLHRKKDS